MQVYCPGSALIAQTPSGNTSPFSGARKFSSAKILAGQSELHNRTNELEVKEKADNLNPFCCKFSHKLPIKAEEL